VRVEQLTPAEWSKVSEAAHKVAFGTVRLAVDERIDYALICVDGTDLKGYLTAKEMDAKTVYWQFGGAFTGTRGTITTFKGYLGFVRWTKERYERVQTRIENKNTAMLKMALQVGFEIVGVRVTQGCTMVELELDFIKER